MQSVCQTHPLLWDSSHTHPVSYLVPYSPATLVTAGWTTEVCVTEEQPGSGTLPNRQNCDLIKLIRSHCLDLVRASIREKKKRKELAVGRGNKNILLTKYADKVHI